MSKTSVDKQREVNEHGVSNLRKIFNEGMDEKNELKRKKEELLLIDACNDTSRLIGLDEMELLFSSGINLKITATTLPHLQGWIALVSWSSDRGERNKMIRISRGGAREFKSIDTLYSIASDYCDEVLVSKGVGYRKIFNLF